MKKIIIVIGMVLMFGYLNMTADAEAIAHDNVMSEDRVYREALQSGLINNHTEYRMKATKKDDTGRVTEYTISIDNGLDWQDYVFEVE